MIQLHPHNTRSDSASLRLAIPTTVRRLLLWLAVAGAAWVSAQSQALGQNTIICPPDITVTTDAGKCYATVEFTTPTPPSGATTITTVECVPASGSQFLVIEPTPVTCTAYDVNNNYVDSCTFVVTVIDLEPPTISCPADSTVTTADGTGAIVDFAVGTLDNCTTLPFTCEPSSGSLFPIGTTPVTCTATDGAGNTASCTFNITVEAPVLEPRQAKIWVREQLASMAAEADVPGDLERFAAAIQYLDAATDPANWADDSRPRPGTLGESVFTNEKSAVGEMLPLVASQPHVMRLVLRVVRVDREIAVIAIQDALDRTGGVVTFKIINAVMSLIRGDIEFACGSFGKAIDNYKMAWKSAVGA